MLAIVCEAETKDNPRLAFWWGLERRNKGWQPDNDTAQGFACYLLPCLTSPFIFFEIYSGFNIRNDIVGLLSVRSRHVAGDIRGTVACEVENESQPVGRSVGRARQKSAGERAV